MSSIVPPDDVNAPIVMLPEHQHPFGADSAITRRMQSVLFHYGVREEECDILEEEEIYSAMAARHADPDGNQEQRDCFEGLVTPHRIVIAWVPCASVCLFLLLRFCHVEWAMFAV